MLHISIDGTQKRSYTKQLYTAIREKILAGELEAGERLPSSRELSGELCLARNTVLTAYDMLVSQGLVHSIAGSGFYVSQGAKRPAPNLPIDDLQTASLADYTIGNETINFDSGLPALELFPRERWNRTVSRSFLDAPCSALGYDDPQGRLELRRCLCSYLKKTRGIACKPEQVIITAGTKQGLSLVAKCLLNSQSQVWIENPSNANVVKIFSYHTRHIRPIEVDALGIRPDSFPEKGRPSLIFTTPSHQFPMGGILPIQRRIALVEFARASGAYLLEDDYDSEFSYAAPPSNSLFELDNERVIYAGTFSKLLFPSIRLGYLVVPEQLVLKIRELKRLADHHSNSIYQLALMRFIESGDLERHIRRMKKEYGKRRDYLLELLAAYFGNQVRLHGANAGLHLVAEFKGVTFTEERMKRLLQAGVYMVSVEQHSLIKELHSNQVILGYGGADPHKISSGLKLLKEEIEYGQA